MYWPTGGEKTKMVTTANHRLETGNHLQNKSETPKLFAGISAPNSTAEFQILSFTSATDIKQSVLSPPALSCITHAAAAPALLSKHVEITLPTYS